MKTLCFEYDYTNNDGVLSRGTDEKKQYIWVNFQKDCMGLYSLTTTLKNIKTDIFHNWLVQSDTSSYFCSANLAKFKMHIQYQQD